MTNKPEKSAGEPVLHGDKRYDLIENFAEAIGWELDFRQLNPGPLASRVIKFGTPELTICRVEFNRSFHQLGHPPKGVFSFGLPDPSSGVLRWSGRDTPPGIVINFNLATRLDVVNEPGDFGGHILCITPEFLAKRAVELGLPATVAAGLPDKEFWHHEHEKILQLREILFLLTTVAQQGGTRELRHWHQVFHTDIPRLLLSVISEEQYKPILKVPETRSYTRQRAVEILGNYDQMPESVNALCRMANCSWDTLRRAFKEEYGVSPKAYMKSQRLAAVQSELIRRGKGAAIVEVANEWGFWHMGSFASDYRRQFGELPSDTLKRL